METRNEKQQRIAREESQELKSFQKWGGDQKPAEEPEKNAEAEREAAAKKEAERLAKRSPEQVEFDTALAGLRSGLIDMQLRAGDNEKLNATLDTLEKNSGYKKE